MDYKGIKARLLIAKVRDKMSTKRGQRTNMGEVTGSACHLGTGSAWEQDGASRRKE